MKIGNIKNEFIADILITADRHDRLRAVPLDKLRTDRNILNEKGFRTRTSYLTFSTNSRN